MWLEITSLIAEPLRRTNVGISVGLPEILSAVLTRPYGQLSTQWINCVTGWLSGTQINSANRTFRNWKRLLQKGLYTPWTVNLSIN